ncbi:hypothetical protein SBOR_6836 [Sclerotinia borealis F-4128]|uniref:BRCT domain-containing protein n=1 Tax=Sclerotinia borealis (strain F-4128) TaxID=1432307 RepID=W9CD82_SCLBF|nr:hypothetical protein SBOR_6836 [Sclerotinia borealis F-4128]
MYRTKQKAEQAALDGESTEEFDTQQCRELQEAIMSSSPIKPAAANSMPVASRNFAINATNNDKEPAGDGKHDNQAQEVFDDIEEPNLSVPNPPFTFGQTINGPPINSGSTPNRNNEGSLRPFDISGKQYQTATGSRMKAMAEEESTQKTNLSLTQENSASVYEALELHNLRNQDVEGNDPDLSSSPPIPIEGEDLSELQQNGISRDPFKVPNSMHTWSTARTYEENDTGHINFDGFQPISAPDEGHFDSQDPPIAPAAEDFVQERHFEPQTPAPLVNPFSEKGSVMKQYELFGATQPSSAVRLGGSPTSSRPSPEVYNGFRSSQGMEPSPLFRRSEVANAISQGSVRSLLRSVSTETPVSVIPTQSLTTVQSFASDLRKLTFTREPQNYFTTMKESQERRRKLSEPEASSGSESESEIEAVSKKYKKAEIDRRKRDETARISLRRPNSSSRPSSAKEVKSTFTTAGIPPRSTNHKRNSSEVTSSRTPQASESTPTAVEVPASGRRRSIQDDYVAQCEGLDARDTQPTQQDMVADSQAAPVSSNIAASSPVPGPRNHVSASTDVGKNGAEPMSPSRRLPKEVQQPANPGATQTSDSTDINKMKEVQCMDSNVSASLDQEQTTSSDEGPDSKNPTASVTQMQDMLSDGVAATIPETSPATERLKPMTEIADVSFGVAHDDQYDDLPGFNMDEEFHAVIGLSNHQIPKPQLNFQPEVVTTPSPVDLIPTASSALVSSGLSSAPSALEPATPVTDDPITPTEKAGSEMASVDRNSREEEQPTEPSDLTSPVQSSKANPERDLPPLASTEHDARRHERNQSEEPKLPSTSRQRRGSVSQSPSRKSTRISKIQSKGVTYSNKRTSTARNKRLLSVSSTASTHLSTTTEPDMASDSISSTNGRPRRNSAVKFKDSTEETPLPAAKRGRPRKFIAPDKKEGTMSAPPSKRKSALPLQEDSEDPLALSAPPLRTVVHSKKSMGNLFSDMAFAVSYVGAEKDKEIAIRLIKQHGGRILEDGFEKLFTPGLLPSRTRTEDNEIGETELKVIPSEANVGFVALIADEHSRKAKHMQALALGLPCISGRWVSDCVNKGTIIDWLPYLLSAGHSSFLGGAVKSRYLRPYSAANANLNDTFTERPKLLDGVSVLIVTGKGKAGEKRKPYTFLTRALNPLRLGQAQDLSQAKEMLLDAESKNADYDWLYVDGKQDVEATIFGSTPASTAGRYRKRKRSSIQEEDVSTPTPKRIRVINDEMIIQSLILGQLIEE